MSLAQNGGLPLPAGLLLLWPTLYPWNVSHIALVRLQIQPLLLPFSAPPPIRTYPTSNFAFVWTCWYWRSIPFLECLPIQRSNSQNFKTLASDFHILQKLLPLSKVHIDSWFTPIKCVCTSCFFEYPLRKLVHWILKELWQERAVLQRSLEKHPQPHHLEFQYSGGWERRIMKSKQAWATHCLKGKKKSRTERTCHSSIREVEPGRLHIQGQPTLHNEDQVNLGYTMKPWEQKQGLG